MNGSCKYPNFTADKRAIAASESVCLTGALASWEYSARVKLPLNMFEIVAREGEKEADHRSDGFRHFRSASSSHGRGMDIWRPINVGPLSPVVVRVTRILDIFDSGDDKVNRSIRSVGIVLDSRHHRTPPQRSRVGVKLLSS